MYDLVNMDCSVRDLGNIVRTANLAAYKKMTKFVEEAFSRKSKFHNLGEIYQACYYVMMYNFGDDLTKKLEDEIPSHLKSVVMVLI